MIFLFLRVVKYTVMPGNFFVQTFNTMLKQLASELADNYDDKPFVVELDIFMQSLPMDSDVAIKLFASSLEPYGQLIVAGDENVYSQIKLDIPSIGVSVELSEIWNDPDTDADTRESIKQYITTLYSLAMTYSNVPGEVVQIIETMSKEMVQKIQDEDMNIENLVPMIINQMKSLFGPDADIDPGSLVSMMNMVMGAMDGDGKNLASLMQS